ncbi:hypothetical protein GT037_002758 [Alternaria burnsii]|uniref:Uncharacterized protein n=1 Tax=Alternaria burnsii TaxID=1187904 RepID=A0A8H7BCV7_9PLEO|nr:uncharacterized protein GT037_002758 [Alternaria burnsii]KAF7679010.1 hypothetical protein GT037_002758 [Alternaria burnsii]
MSELSNVLPVADQISLVLHTSVDFCRKAGVGIGIIQHAAIGAARSCILPVEEQKHGIERGQYGANNVKTYERAHMYALILAMGLARKTLRRRCTTMRIKVQSVTVFCTLPSVVALIQYHQAHGSESLESVVSPEDRSMIKRVLASAKKLSRYDVQVSISEDGEESFNLEAARVKMMALQGKKRAYRRRHERRIMSKNAGAAGDNEEGGGSDEGRNRVGHEEEMRQDSSHLRPMTRRESSGIFKMDETGEPELHLT